MDNKEHGSQRGIPRLSRIPLPRAVRPVNILDSPQNGSENVSHIPRPLNTNSLRLKGIVPLSEAANQSLRSNHSRNNPPARTRSPERTVLPRGQPESLETTPPSESGFHYVEGDENSTKDGLDTERRKRRPRPSLSERTVETLSQMPPSPSPSKGSSSIISSRSSMAPPSRPASSLRSSRSNVNLRGRSTSPSKQAFRPPGRLESSFRDTPPVPLIPDYGNIYTPPKVLVKGSRIAVVSQDVQYTNSTVNRSRQTQQPSSNPTSFAHKARSMHNLRGAAEKAPSSRPSLASVFKDPPVPSFRNSTLVTKPYYDHGTGNSFLKYQPSGENGLASLPSVKATKPALSDSSSRSLRNIEQPSTEEKSKALPKTSTTLRETIAKAKAAKREAAKKPAATAPMSSNNAPTDTEHDLITEEPIVGNSQRTVQRRLDNAIGTGTLNLAAMSLKSLPDGIKSMYDFDPNSTFSWSETVDLTKLIAADNELEELSDDFFPDWSIQELEDDDDKSNHFGGLQVLDLRGNRLKKLPVGLRRLEHLHTLILSNNLLENDALEIICQIPNLRELNLGKNRLQGTLTPSLANLTELHILDLQFNRLSELPSSIADLRKLQKLNMSNNNLRDVPLKSMCNLPILELYLSKNALSGVLFQESVVSTKLQLLDVASNKLQSLSDDQFNFPKLQSLVCDNNQLKALPNLSQLGSLSTLTASENKIEALPDSFTALRSLRSANMSANHIKVLDPHIANMEQLTNLDISANPLRERKFLAMKTDDLKSDLARRLAIDAADTDDTFQTGRKENMGPAASSDKIHGIHKPEKGVLNLSSRSIAFVDTSTIDLSQPIHTVRLSNNDLTEFPLELLAHPTVKHSLKSLDISHNQSLHSTRYLTTGLSLPVLQSLSIVSTGLTSIDALLAHLSAPALKELNISCHRMTGRVPHLRVSFPSITTLLATDNWFTSIDVEAIHGLEVIDVSNNDIDHLPPKIGELGNLDGTKAIPGRLRAFECSGNKFRVPRLAVIEKGTEAILRDLRRMVPTAEVDDEWRE